MRIIRQLRVPAPSRDRRSSATKRRIGAVLGALALLAAALAPAHAERIKDLAQVGGVRGNALVGYGLVVGLDNSGDRTSQAPFTVQSLKNMLGELGVNVPANVNPQLKNVAAVAIHAELPPFAKPGQPIDITVSSIGNAVSLRGGSLLMAPLKGADGQVYAIAQGNLTISVQENPQVSQPAPLSGGQTVVTQTGQVDIAQDGGALFNVRGGANLADVVKALNTLGAKPMDLVSILQAMKAAGALRAELEVI